MPVMTMVHASTTTPQVLREDELRRAFGIGSKSNVIPFIQTILAQSNTASRSLLMEIDPRKRRGEGDSNPITAPTVNGQYMHGQLQVVFDQDLTFRPVPINLPIRGSWTLESSDSGIWTLIVFYVLIEGNFFTNTDVLKKLSDRNRMDIFDTDEAGQSFYRMGKSRQMGDGEPGT